MLKYSILISTVLLLYTSCKKESIAPAPPQDTSTTELIAGLPNDPDSIHGYFFSGYNFHREISSKPQDITCFAMFADPATDFVSHIDRRNSYQVYSLKYNTNVGMGIVHYNGTSLSGNGGYYELNNGPPSLIDQQASWKVDGNIVIPGFSEELKNEFPVLKDAPRSFSVHANQGFTLTPSDYFDEWDSVVVKIVANNSFVYTAGGKGDSPLVISSKRLDFLPNYSNGILLIRAFKFFHRTIQGRRYLYELSSGVVYQAQISR